MRLRTIWDWRLKLYPLVVIPMIFYVAAQTSESPSRHVSGVASSDSRSVVAAPLSGIHKGVAVTCERRPLITFCHTLTKERR